MQFQAQSKRLSRYALSEKAIRSARAIPNRKIARAVNNHCKELVDAENMVMRKIRMLNEFKDMSDNNIKTRARMIARSLGKQLCEYEKNEIKRQNFQHNLETVKQQNTTQTSNTTKNSGNTTTSTNTTTGGKSKTGEKTKTSRKDEANGKSEANGKDAKIKDS